MTRHARLLALSLLVAACAETRAGDDAASAPAPDPWSVDPEPVVSIGVVEGPAHYQLTYPQAALRLPDGGILIADGGDKQLRFYDASGAFTKAVGGEGEGPGEFRFLRGAWLFAGDSIVASDPMLRRLSVFDATGEFVRSYRMEGIPGFAPEVLDVFRRDGALLVQPLQAGDVLHISAGPRRDTLAISVVAPIGVLERVVGDFPISEMFGAGAVFGQRAFGAERLIAAGADRFYYASSDSFRIRAFDRGGRLLHTIARNVPAVPITAEDEQEWREARIASASGRGREFTIRFAEEMTFPEARPVLRAMLVDRPGNLWVRTFGDSDAPGRWLVFDASGNDIAQVDLPIGLVPTDIGDDWILGIVRDDDGVPQVRMHRLTRAESEGTP